MRKRLFDGGARFMETDVIDAPSNIMANKITVDNTRTYNLIDDIIYCGFERTDNSDVKQTDNNDLSNIDITGGAKTIRDEAVNGVIPTVISECSLIAETSDNVCASTRTVREIAKILAIAETDRAAIMARAKEILGCDSERAVLAHSRVAKALPGAKTELATNYKLIGPLDTSLLSNINIDGILTQWKAKFKDFYAYNFNMVNFRENNDTLHTVNVVKDIYDAGFKTAACVVNSDKYSGGGKHWMAIFVDMRNAPFTVEFFNSAGDYIQKEFDSWLDSTAAALTAAGHITNVVRVTKVEHQRSRTECGVYALLYIWARLCGVGYEFFMNRDITDYVCFEFRQHLFADPRAPQMGEFDVKKFEEFGRIKWESDVSSHDLAKMRKNALVGGVNIVKGGVNEIDDRGILGQFIGGELPRIRLEWQFRAVCVAMVHVLKSNTYSAINVRGFTNTEKTALERVAKSFLRAGPQLDVFGDIVAMKGISLISGPFSTNLYGFDVFSTNDFIHNSDGAKKLPRFLGDDGCMYCNAEWTLINDSANVISAVIGDTIAPPHGIFVGMSNDAKFALWAAMTGFSGDHLCIKLH